MQINKTYVVASALLVVMAAGTAWLVFKAPSRPEQASLEVEGLAKPRGLALTKDGLLLIADSRNNRIVVQKADGSVKKRFGRLGTAKGELREPCDVAVGPDGKIYVADTFFTLDPNGGLPWGRIQKFDDDFDFLTVFPKPEEGPNDFFGPRALAVDPEGRIWVSDTGNHRLVIYGKDGKFLKSLGQKGPAPLEFQEPFGLDFDAQGNAYVADRLNFRIQVISKDFRALRQFKVDGWENTQINVEPYVVVDAQRGRVYVSDPTHKKVLSYTLEGKDKKEITQGMDGPVAAAFALPTGLALAPDGTLYVSDGGSGRVLSVKP
jgi:sugar lactone lactonase YvrE